jgi:hypothetical protein
MAPVPIENLPTPHNAHTEAPMTLEKVLDGQATHVPAKLAPEALEYVPIPQLMHPPSAVEYVPTAQVRQTDA